MEAISGIIFLQVFSHGFPHSMAKHPIATFTGVHVHSRSIANPPHRYMPSRKICRRMLHMCVLYGYTNTSTYICIQSNASKPFLCSRFEGKRFESKGKSIKFIHRDLPSFVCARRFQTIDGELTTIHSTAIFIRFRGRSLRIDAKKQQSSRGGRLTQRWEKYS